MQEELESVEDAAKRAELRGKYIELFIDLSTISNIQPEIDDEEHEEKVEGVAEEPSAPESRILKLPKTSGLRQSMQLSPAKQSIRLPPA